MTNRSYSILSLGSVLFMLLLTTSCTKLLEQEPKNSTYEEVFWQNGRDCRAAIAGNYALLRDAVTDKADRYYMYGDAIAKNYFTIQYTGDGLEGIQNGDFTFQYNINSLGVWTKYYKVIAMSNLVIKKVSALTEEQLSDEDDPATFKSSILGQALYIRALTYFMMVRVWGDVPLVTESYDDPLTAPQLPRSPKADVMKQIEDDCHEAASLLDWGYTDVGDAKVTANKGAVYALLAHLYMWRGTMNDVTTINMTDINSADTTINQIITRGGYSLTDTANYYKTFIGRSNESIFELNMSENTLEGSNAHIGLYFLRSNTIPYYGSDSRFYVNTSYLDNHFGLGGQWEWNEEAWEWQWITIRDSTDVRYLKAFDFVKTSRPNCIKYSNVEYRNPAQQTDAYLSNNMIIFRLADMMLLQAEIAIYQGNLDKAKDIINFFRTRNNASEDIQLEGDMSQEAVMYEYMLERGKELFLEGHLFYDLLRTRMYVYFIDWLPESRFLKEGFYWPVYPGLFKENKFLKQTTYWLGKV